MAALGKILRKGGGHSVHTTAQYERLNQDPSDNEEEEDDILFIQEGGSKGQNGFTHARNGKEPLLTNGTTTDNSIELSELGIQKGRIRPASEVEVRVMKRGRLSRMRTACFVLTMVMAVGIVIGLIVLLPQLRRFGGSRGKFNQSSEWEISYPEYMTESLIRLVDVDEDGRLDIILSVFPGARNGDEAYTRSTQDELCRKNGYKSSPCLSVIRALRGHDHALLWEIRALSSVFEMTCNGIDVDRDGKPDCVATGRMSTLVAFNPRNGSVFWTGEDAQFQETWNTYNVLPVYDLDGDGTNDLVVAHGGDPEFPPSFIHKKHRKKVKTRYAGRLMLLSGATGIHIGSQKYVDLPDSKETYMSPVLHQRKDGSMYVLFGHGGETVPGTLFAISLPDLYRLLNNIPLTDTEPTPQQQGDYSHTWGRVERNGDGLFEIYRSQSKGVMVAPVCVDTNGDGVTDILMSAYDGTITLYDGETLKKLWSTSFTGMESYSSPAPAYFNDDDVVDFMIHENYGAWPAYNGSKKLILDGQTGAVLWSLDAANYDMTSDLVVRTTEEHRDAYLVHISGRGAKTPAARHKRTSLQDGFLQNHRRKNGPLSPKYPPLSPKYPPLSPKYPPPSPTRRPQVNRDRWGYGRDYDNNYGIADNTAGSYPGYYGRGQAKPYGTKGSSYGDQGAPYGDQFGDLYQNYMYDPATDTIADDEGMERGLGAGVGGLGGHGGYFGDPQEEEEGMRTMEDGEEPEEEEDDSDDDASPSCALDPAVYTTEVLLMDRTTTTQPLLVYKFVPVKHTYNFTQLEREALKTPPEDSSSDDHDKSRRSNHGNLRVRRHGDEHAPPPPTTRWSNTACVMLAATNKATGAVGDVDGDGTLDLVLVLDKLSLVTDAQTGDYIRQDYETSIVKLNLEARQRDGDTYVGVSPTVNTVVTGDDEVELRAVRLRPGEDQPWAGYMGTTGHSVYDGHGGRR